MLKFMETLATTLYVTLIRNLLVHHTMTYLINKFDPETLNSNGVLCYIKFQGK